MALTLTKSGNKVNLRRDAGTALGNMNVWMSVNARVEKKIGSTTEIIIYEPGDKENAVIITVNELAGPPADINAALTYLITNFFFSVTEWTESNVSTSGSASAIAWTLQRSAVPNNISMGVQFETIAVKNPLTAAGGVFARGVCNVVKQIGFSINSINVQMSEGITGSPNFSFVEIGTELRFLVFGTVGNNLEWKVKVKYDYKSL